MKLKNVVKKVVLTSTVMGLAVSSFAVNVDAKSYTADNADVTLEKNMPWANADKMKNTKQMSQSDGYVYKDSKKGVAYVLEYRDPDLGQWVYEIPSDQWTRWEADTKVPSDTGRVHVKTDCRLQLNPWGAGNNGKGGHAYGFQHRLK